MATADPLADAAALFCELTGRLGLTSVEFDQMKQYGWEQMPPSIVARALTEAVEKMRPERKPKARIAWFRHDVADLYDTWRRAVGHS